MPKDSIATSYAAGLLGMAQERGYPLDDICARAGLTFDPLNRNHSQYHDQIDSRTYSALYEQVLLYIEDEGYGVWDGVVNPGAFRMLCYAIIGCENLGKALRRASEFFCIFLSEKAQLTLATDDNYAHIGYVRKLEESTDNIQHMEVYALALWHRFCGWLTGYNLPLITVKFQCDDAGLNMRKLFTCKSSFNEKVTEFVIPAECLGWPIVHTEQSLRDFLRTAPSQLMTMPVDGRRSSFVEQVKAMIGHDFSRGMPAFQEIADRLHMSAATLRRRLKKEGKTFQQIKDECRTEAAVAYLYRPDLSISAVATLMGFTDPSAFHRSFKKWTGTPPGQFRFEALAATASSTK